jgi:phosphatidylserine decarboxylase
MKFRALWEARWILGILAACWVATLALFPLLSLVVAGMMLFSLYFFRDPEREPPADESLAVSPADGVVVEVSEEDAFIMSLAENIARRQYRPLSRPPRKSHPQRPRRRRRHR